MKLLIRPAAVADAEAIHRVHTASVRELCARSYDSRTIEGWLLGRSVAGYLRGISNGITVVAQREGQVVGFSEAVSGEVLAVFVDPASSRSGVGAALLAEALERAGGDRVNIRLEATLNAVGFYERFGFVSTAQRTVRRNDVDVPVVVMERRAG